MRKESGDEREVAPGVKEVKGRVSPWLTAFYLAVSIWGVWFLVYHSSGIPGTFGKGAASPAALAAAPGASPTAAPPGGEGALLSRGKEVFDANCASCHGPGGTGGVGPAFVGGKVKVCFPTAEEQLAFVKVGTQQRKGARYGAADSCVARLGDMPSWGGVLSEEELRAVVAYTRNL